MKKTMIAFIALLMLSGCGSASEEKKTGSPEAMIHAESSDPVVSDKEYIYCVGSVSKIYSTAAVMQLVDQGLVEPDTPVTEYIPDFTMADDRYRDITVRMLMDHTSGILGSVGINSDLYDDNDGSHHDNLLNQLSKQRLRNDPGKYAAYCNDGFGLLEIIVENVTGMSYTEYVRENISDAIGVTHTGTPLDLFGSDMLVPSFSAGNRRLDTCYCMCLGDGGIYATASDTAVFGASFFTGDDTLLSDAAKEDMATRRSDNAYEDDNGLGWDYAEMLRYEQQGVKVVGKGGDVSMDHAFLMVAPDEQISIAVLSNGGSSAINDLVAQTLMDVVLEERGIMIEEPGHPDCTIIENIPEEYNDYAGWYVMTLGEGDTLCRISFPEGRYLHIEKISSRKTTYTDYVYTADGDFAELAYEVEESGFDKRLYAGGSSRLSFEKNADGTFIRQSGGRTYPGIGTINKKTYSGQRIEQKEVSGDVTDGYRAYDRNDFLLVSDKYSSQHYEDTGIARISVIDELDGYAFLTGRGVDFLVEMADGEHLISPKNMPSSSSRDLMDVTVGTDENGRTVIDTSTGQRYVSAEGIPELGISDTSVELKETAGWYDISDNLANTPLTIERPENSAVIVFNRFDEMIYSSHVKDAGNVIPTPKGGRVLFLGQSGDVFEIR